MNPNNINSPPTAVPCRSTSGSSVSRCPLNMPGAGRRVYPGVAQLTAFMSMNARRHLGSHVELYRALVAGDGRPPPRIRDFYDEYGAVMDVPAEFYLETLQRVFMEHDLPAGRVHLARASGRPLRHPRPRCSPSRELRTTCAPPARPRRPTGCAPGSAERRHHHLQEGVGHYGVFAGSRWENDIYPVFRRSSARTRPRARPPQFPDTQHSAGSAPVRPIST